MNKKVKAIHMEIIQALDDRIEKAERNQVERLEQLEQKVTPYDKFLARTPLVKDFYFALLKAKEYVEKEHQQELKYSKRDVFPKGWMLKSVKIEHALNRCPLICPLLNNLFNRNRYIRGEDYSEMKGNNQHYLDGAKHNSKWEYSTFVGDKAFFEELSKELGKSVPTIKKHFQVLCEADILKKWKKGHLWLYADGYFTEKSSYSKHKISFLKSNPTYKKALRNLQIEW